MQRCLWFVLLILVACDAKRSQLDVEVLQVIYSSITAPVANTPQSFVVHVHVKVTNARPPVTERSFRTDQVDLYADGVIVERLGMSLFSGSEPSTIEPSVAEVDIPFRENVIIPIAYRVPKSARDLEIRVRGMDPIPLGRNSDIVGPQAWDSPATPNSPCFRFARAEEWTGVIASLTADTMRFTIQWNDDNARMRRRSEGRDLDDLVWWVHIAPDSLAFRWHGITIAGRCTPDAQMPIHVVAAGPDSGQIVGTLEARYVPIRTR